MVMCSERCDNMSLFNFLDLNDSGYGNFAKGILYVICEIFWKIIYAVNSLIDVVTGLFYKLAGVNYLGSGSETLVEEQDLLSKLFNQNIVSDVSLFMIIVSILLMAVFGTSAVLKKLYFSKEDGSSTADIIKNMILSFLFLVCLAPLALFAISSISTITSAIAGIFGDTTNVSLADLMFNISFSGDAVEAYNGMYATEIGAGTLQQITNWTEINNDFLFDLLYGNFDTGVTFYWYVYLLGGGVVLFNLISIVFKLVKRIFMIIILYLTAPVYVARMVDDGGVKFREWKNKTFSELISIVGTVVAFMLLISMVGIINDIELVSTEIANAGTEGSIGSVMLLANEGVEVNTTAVLINNLTKMLLVMAGTSVARDSGELLGNVFKGANDDSNSLLEGIFNRLGPKETTITNKSEQSAPRTRVITKTTTSTRKVVNFTESVPSSNSNPKDRGVNINNNQRTTVNANINNVDRRVNNIQNRAEVNMTNGTRVSDTGAKSGNYRNNTDATNIKPTDILNQQLVSGFKNETDKIRSEWNFLKENNSASSKEVVKDFESASKDLDSSISVGEQNKIKNSMNKYVEAYRKEEKVAKEGYKDFSQKSTKLSNDLSAKQQEELKKISASYRKAQVEYGKTARKLSEVSQGNMSTSDALRVKERADKQREKLMEASSRASDFYNNQKKGV